jgi:hypothetical protein
MGQTNEGQWFDSRQLERFFSFFQSFRIGFGVHSPLYVAGSDDEADDACKETIHLFLVPSLRMHDSKSTRYYMSSWRAQDLVSLLPLKIPDVFEMWLSVCFFFRTYLILILTRLLRSIPDLHLNAVLRSPSAFYLPCDHLKKNYRPIGLCLISFCASYRNKLKIFFFFSLS